MDEATQPRPDHRTEDEKSDGRFKVYYDCPGIAALKPLEQRLVPVCIPRLPPDQTKILIETAFAQAPFAVPAGIYHVKDGKAKILISNWNPEEKLRLQNHVLLAAGTPVVETFDDSPYLQAMTTDISTAKSACQQQNERDFDEDVTQMLGSIQVDEPGDQQMFGSMTVDDGDEDKDNNQLRKELNGFSQAQLDKWLETEFRFKDSPFLQKDPILRASVLQVLREYSDVISVSKTDYGKTDVLMAHLRLQDPYTQPYRAKVRPINPAQEESLQRQIDDWMKEKVVRPSESPWSAGLVPALKTSFDINKKTIELLIEKKIKKHFPNSNFLIENTSNKHKKHKQNIQGNETHFKINLRSKKFFKLSKLERQKYFINVLGEEIINKVHSISFKLTAPNEKKI